MSWSLMSRYGAVLAAVGLIGCHSGSSTDPTSESSGESDSTESTGSTGDESDSGTDEGQDACEAGVSECFVPCEGCVFAYMAPTTEFLENSQANIDQILAVAGEPLTVSDVIADLDKEGRPGVGTDLSTPGLVGFRWNEEDDSSSEWFPQGITGSSDAFAGGLLDGRHILMSSSYSKSSNPERGARIAIADITDLENVRYTHMLLVKPTNSGSFVHANTGSGPLHAGGIVWIGDLLFVADTDVGLRVYDLTQIIPMTHTDDSDRLGVDGDRVDAFGLRYAVPQIFRYRRTEDGKYLRHSWTSLDRSSDPPVILAGEFDPNSSDATMARWPVDLETDWLLTSEDGTRVDATGSFIAGYRKMQGAASWEGDYVFSTGLKLEEGVRKLVRQRPDEDASIYPWIYGGEDLYIDRHADLLWTGAEFQDQRDVIGIPRVPQDG